MNFYRVGDLLPPLEIHVRDNGVIIDLTPVIVQVRWQRPDGSEIAEREAVPLDVPTSGNAIYDWELGDLSIPGVYRAIVQLESRSSAERFSLTDPPVLDIEVLSEDFEPVIPGLPLPSAFHVAALLGIDAGTLNGATVTYAIGRASRLAAVYTQMWRCPGHALSDTDSLLMRDLIAELAAWALTSNPTVTYGPYAKEAMGSYSYTLRDASTAAGGTAVTGIPHIDQMADYFVRLFRNCDETGGLAIEYPEWWTPFTEMLSDPTSGGTGLRL